MIPELVKEHGGKVDVNAQVTVMNHLERWSAAVQAGDLEQIDSLLEEGIVPVDLLDAYTTPLLQAICRGDREMAELVLARGADVEAAPLDQHRPLAMAALLGRLELVDLLLESGASLDPPVGGTPIEAAASMGQVAVIGRLLDAGAAPTFHPTMVDSSFALGALLTVALERDMSDWVDTIRDLRRAADPDADSAPADA